MAKAFTARRAKYLMRRLLRALGRATGTSSQIALGVAIGFFVGWLPIVGIQMIVAVTVCTLVRANKIVPLFPIWLTNPVTIIPIYSFNYWVGWKLVGGPPLSNLVTVLRRMLTPPAPEPGINRIEAWWDSIHYSLGELVSMGWEMQLPLWIGCVLVGGALAVPGYYLSKRFVESFREAVLRKRQIRHDRRRKAAGVDVSIDGGYNHGHWLSGGSGAGSHNGPALHPPSHSTAKNEKSE